MKIQPSQLLRWAFAGTLSALLSLGCAHAGTTIAFGSSVGATNLVSSGGVMHDGFVFQLGTFDGGFIPAAGNTDFWLGAWRPASDREGEPLVGNIAAYLTQDLGDGFPAGFRVNSFSSSVTLDHNEPPFDLGGQLYIWGYDQRATPGAAEWILISDPTWIWPDGSSNQPAASYAVSGATISVVGEIKGDGFEMQTAAVTVPDSSAGFYEGWLAANFTEGVLGNPALELEVWGEFADPDRDRLSNLMEYFTGNDPNAAATTDVLSQPEISGDDITVEFRQSLSAIGVSGLVEWSTDLQSWSRQGIVQEAAGEDATHATLRASWPIGEASKAFFRLTVQHAP
jgi:hypothetical protein